MRDFAVDLFDRYTRRSALGALGSVWLAGCAPLTDTKVTVRVEQLPERLRPLLPCPALLLGELHDAPDHPPLQEAVLRALASEGVLAALVLEMAEQGQSTRGLPPTASEDEVRRALAWQDGAWPWSRYRQPVMAAVRAGAPVFGGNLPRDGMRKAMEDESLDALLPAPALKTLRERVREGHCHLLPEQHIPGMTRIQIARDVSMAHAVARAWQPGRTAVLLCGNEHARQDLGVAHHLRQLQVPWPASAGAVQSVLMGPAGDRVAPAPGTHWPTASQPRQDHCAELRQRLPR